MLLKLITLYKCDVKRLLHIVAPIELELGAISTYILHRFKSQNGVFKQQFSGGGFLKYIK